MTNANLSVSAQPLWSLPATFDATIEETTYRVAARPVQYAVIGAALAVVLFLALVVLARRRSGAVVNPFVPALALVPIGFLFFSYAARRVNWLGGDEHASSTLFRGVIMTEAAVAGIGLGVALAAGLVLALRTENQLRLLPLALPCMIAGIALVPFATRARELCDVGSMPFYQVQGHRQMHAGRDRGVAVALVRPPRRRWLFGMENGPQPVDDTTRAHWVPVSHVHVHAAEAGMVPFTAEARRGPVTLSTKLTVHALTERASPLLSLRVGDRAVYRVRARSSDGAVLYFITLHGSETIHEVTIEVVGTRERDGFRTFVIDVNREDTRREVEVIAISGETRLYDAEHGTIGAPIVAFNGESSQPDPVPCTFALLDAGHALCQRGGRSADVPAPAVIASPSGAKTRGSSRRAPREDPVGRPPVAFAGAAPSTFQRNTSSTSGGLATAFFAIITIGLVILPDGSSSSSYTLVSTQRGPEGAPEAPSG